MNKTKESRPHIGIFGKRNTGKSSLVNLLAGQEVAIVSDKAGTTTDPVSKLMEIFGVGPVVLIDTAGIDDEGMLGEKRIAKSKEVIKTIDLALLVVTNNSIGAFEQELITLFKQAEVPCFIVHNKIDAAPLLDTFKKQMEDTLNISVFPLSINTHSDTTPIIDEMKRLLHDNAWKTGELVGDLIKRGDVVLMITPIDNAAPEGRMILPQVQLIRNVLDNNAIVITCKETEVAEFYSKMQPKPAIVVTDSQVFEMANKVIPPEIPLTSFSIILARQKGAFDEYLKGTPKLKDLKKGDRVLILESCNHQVSCDDIGRVKIPAWLNKFTNQALQYDVVAGLDKLPRDIKDYAMLIQCGGCMITRKQLINRLRPAIDAGIPITNYGMAIAYVHGIFNRAVEVFRK